ncbi:glycosyltransferase [Cellulomonas fimi]|uniref:glycosyltransferase family 2 protein n=1 Tax=Cellulomonas sp. RIT-PI-Y TaxID=3035297 RepID=UPI0021DB2AF5
MIDLLVPYYGDPEYFRALVRSVLAQTDHRWRLVVVDDANPDPWAGPWLQSLSDERIVYRRNEQNRGISEVFRQCVQLAEAELLAVPGSDDLLDPDYVAVVLAAHARFPHVDIIQPGVRVIDGAGEPAAPLADTVKQRLVRPRGDGARVLAGERLAVSLLHGDWLYWPSLVFRRTAVQEMPFRPGLPIILDLALVLDLVLAGSELLIEPTECFAYRRHRESASSVKLLDGSRFAGEREYFQLAAALMHDRGWRRAARAARLHATSRLYALTLLPTALRRQPRAVGTLLRHVLGN